MVCSVGEDAQEVSGSNVKGKAIGIRYFERRNHDRDDAIDGLAQYR